MPALRTAFTAFFVLAIGASAAAAQPAARPDPYGYYSQYDRSGYFDRDGHYRYFVPPPPPPPPAATVPPPAPVAEGAFYEPAGYDPNCHRGNATAGTILGALAGGLLGSAATHGNGGAVIGGAVLGGVLGNTIGRDIDCEDQPYAVRVYTTSIGAPIGHRYEWHHGEAHGWLTPVREFHRGGVVCRTFTETSFRRGRAAVTREGTACRHDGRWRFE